MLIHAARRPQTAHDDTSAPDTITWSVEAVDYETGKAEIDAAVPEGWVLLWVRPER